MTFFCCNDNTRADGGGGYGDVDGGNGRVYFHDHVGIVVSVVAGPITIHQLIGSVIVTDGDGKLVIAIL